jgi:hypothetical protein
MDIYRKLDLEFTKPNSSHIYKNPFSVEKIESSISILY